MTDEDTRIPVNEESVIEYLKEEKEDELTEQEKNLAITQAKIIGDID